MIVLRCASVSSSVAWREASKGLDAASTGYGKTFAFFHIRWNPAGCPFSTRPRFAHKTSSNQTPIDKIGKKPFLTVLGTSQLAVYYYFSFFRLTSHVQGDMVVKTRMSAMRDSAKSKYFFGRPYSPKGCEYPPPNSGRVKCYFVRHTQALGTRSHFEA